MIAIRTITDDQARKSPGEPGFFFELLNRLAPPQ
jgi:hypothetical protein